MRDREGGGEGRDCTLHLAGTSFKQEPVAARFPVDTKVPFGSNSPKQTGLVAEAVKIGGSKRYRVTIGMDPVVRAVIRSLPETRGTQVTEKATSTVSRIRPPTVTVTDCESVSTEQLMGATSETTWSPAGTAVR